MRLLATVLLFQLCVCHIIGIDFGSQFIKVAYQPFGRPPEIVTDPSGKRKIENSVFFGEGLRSYGNMAESSAVSKPELVYSGMNALLGEGAESNVPASFQQRHFPYEFVLTERNTWSLRLLPESGFGDMPTLTVEELNGMILNYVVSLVQKEFNDSTRDVVISVPSSFTQTQRQALLDAATLANLNVLSLIDQTTASAVTYAMTRAPDGVKRLLIYDVGSRHTEVSAVEIETSRDESGRKRSVVVLGKESSEVGGDDFTNVVMGVLTDRFESAFHVDPRADSHLCARLRADSQRYKEILSANREVQISESSVFEGHDLQFTLTREEFEDDAITVVDQILHPLQALLEKLNMGVVRFSPLISPRPTSPKFS